MDIKVFPYVFYTPETEFALGVCGIATFYVKNKTVTNARVERTLPNIFSADETADVGLDNQTPVALGIGYGPEETMFTGKINKVTVALN